MAKTVVHLKEYLRQFHAGPDDRNEVPLFFSLRAGRPHMLSTDAISVVVKKYGESARTGCAEVPPRVHPHLFDIAVRCISISAGCHFPILRNSWDMQA